MAVTASTGTFHEVEIKLDAGAGFALPDLSALPGVASVSAAQTEDLEAVYLDSRDLRLIGHGTTLRRRTGGADAGWHLKLPAKVGRIEVREPLNESVRVVPARLLGLVRAQVRDEPLAAVARIATRRTLRRLLGADGVVLAEVADDLVTAEAMGEVLTTDSWREIEVELVAGDDALLRAAAGALIAAGAQPSGSGSKLKRALGRRLSAMHPVDVAVESQPPVGESAARRKKGARAHRKAKPPRLAVPAKRPLTAGDVVVAYLVEHLDAMLAQDPQVRLDEPEGVHQMRVATRRLRATLATFRPLFTDGSAELLRDELKWLGGLLGLARDPQVMAIRLRQEIAEQPAELVVGPVLARVESELGRAYREAHAVAVEALDGDRYLALLAALEQFVEHPPFSGRGRRPAGELRSRVRKACSRVRAAAAGLAAAAAGEESDHSLHAVRIAAKRARYAAEAARPVAGEKARTLAAAMAQIQETLGDHQDAVVERGWLRALAARAFLAGEDSFTFGRLHGLTDARAGHDEAAFAQVWAASRRVMSDWPG